MSGILELVTKPEAWASLLTLTLLEVVLGIDNIVFLTLVVGRLPPQQRPSARRIGLTLALGMRVAMLLGLSYMMSLTKPIVTVFGHGIGGRDAILIGGGVFLVWKATHEIFARVEDEDEQHGPKVHAGFLGTVVQIVLLDIVFSIDSVVTAVGMSNHLPIMITAVVIAVILMLLFAGTIGEFVESHPSMKVLALAFLVLIGVLLVAEGFGQHIPRGYVYSALGFSLAVNLLEIKLKARRRASRPASASHPPKDLSGEA
jgi:predicted tellurium resistance membrane protein TerC